MLGILTTEGL